LKILFFAPYKNIHGPLPKHTPILIKALENKGAIVTYMPWGRHSDDESLVQKIFSRFIDANRINRQIKNKDFDIIVLKTGHNFSSLTRDIYLLSLIHGHGKKIVIEFHGSQSNKLVIGGNFIFKWMSQKLLSFADSIVVLSSEEQIQWRQFDPKVVCYTTANPYVPPQITITDFPRKDNILLFVGRLIEEKGVIVLLDSFQRVLRSYDCSLVIAGEGKLRNFLEQKVENLNLKSKIKFTGYVKEKELYELYKSSTMLVLPTYFYEGFPTVITEAMYMGLPIITTPIRGARDYLKENINALFVPPKDSITLANAIMQLLNDKNLREEMGVNNAILVKEFTPEKIGQDYFEIITNTLNS